MTTNRSSAAPALRAAFTILSILWVAASGPAQVRDHGEGFLLRLSMGGGGAATEATDAGMTMRLSGPAADFNFAIGGIVSPNLALHGTLFGWSVTDPEIEISGVTASTDGDLSLAGFGGGLTYYVMPANIYLSGSLGLGRFELKHDNLSARSSGGLIVDATIGKEWWVGDSWGLGVALGLSLHSISDEDIEDNWSGGSVAVRFTATMN